MTIIKNTTPLPNYPFQALTPEVVNLMERRVPSVRGSSVTLKLFECYCDLMGATVTYLGLSSPRYTELAKGYVGALKGKMFVANEDASRQHQIRRFVLMHWAFHAIRPLSPPTSGHLFHGHPAGQSERSDAGLHC
ncbi:hypothetical protein SAMN04490203_0761 [Pseudomonas taetrolens]|uniref:Integrase n=1 Tax=Pseudomonas taetrolens TaxID=47884 RepID=A0A1H4KNU4_PSETA|nr:hypothetical protein SAMN04490203_0761 [Pseudomonas taetrolens]SQF84955.1 Uncharacterised protein [Pseudomonas taetrolens]VEH47433.1 Uncharacterised protein [Pseudomonas taetrolens]